MSNRNLLITLLCLAGLIATMRIAESLWWENPYARSEALLALLNRKALAPPLDDKFPCVLTSVLTSGTTTQLTKCELPIEHSGSTDQFEVDLRDGAFILRQSDLHINDVFDVPLTRTYNSTRPLHLNPVHAFGRNTNHPYDIAPLGSSFPYTYQILVLEDGNLLYFPRISRGTGYSDAVFQHTETATSFYKAVTRWNGNGWTTWRADGSALVFPESYKATTAAQGAATRNA